MLCLEMVAGCLVEGCSAWRWLLATWWRGALPGDGCWLLGGGVVEGCTAWRCCLVEGCTAWRLVAGCLVEGCTPWSLAAGCLGKGYGSLVNAY